MNTENMGALLMSEKELREIMTLAGIGELSLGIGTWYLIYRGAKWAVRKYRNLNNTEEKES